MNKEIVCLMFENTFNQVQHSVEYDPKWDVLEALLQEDQSKSCIEFPENGIVKTVSNTGQRMLILRTRVGNIVLSLCNSRVMGEVVICTAPTILVRCGIVAIGFIVNINDFVDLMGTENTPHIGFMLDELHEQMCCR